MWWLKKPQLPNKYFTENLSNPSFSVLYLTLHDQMELGTLKPEHFDFNIQQLAKVPLDAQKLLRLTDVAEPSREKIEEAFMCLVRGIDDFEGIWRSDLNNYILNLPPRENIDDVWVQSHVQFYHKVKMILIQRAYRAREILLVAGGFLK